MTTKVLTKENIDYDELITAVCIWRLQESQLTDFFWCVALWRLNGAKCLLLMHSHLDDDSLKFEYEVNTKHCHSLPWKLTIPRLMIYETNLWWFRITRNIFDNIKDFHSFFIRFNKLYHILFFIRNTDEVK